MNRRAWLRTLAAAGATHAASVLPGVASPLLSHTGLAAVGTAGWLGEALPALPVEPRRLRAYDLRVQAAYTAARAGAPAHLANADEARLPAFLGMFSKGLPHDHFGFVEPEAYRMLARAAASGQGTQFEAVPMGGSRRLVSPQAAFAFALDGLDAAMVDVAAPPSIDSPVFAAEAVELYWMALLRDLPFARYQDDARAAGSARELTKVSGRAVTPATLFTRQATPSSSIGFVQPPGGFVSQFLLRPVPMGAQAMSARIGAQTSGEQFLTRWDGWLASQNGALPAVDVSYDGRRFISTGRDLATWVRTDYPGQAGVQAALILESLRAPVSERHPYVQSRNQAGYVTFGLPFVVDLASRVAMHALRAAWFQKWVLHRRLRPEELGGHLEAAASGAPVVVWPDQRLMQSEALGQVRQRTGTLLLPMAWPEGAPLHPSYPAAHAATAGAMVTVLKAYYDHAWVLPDPVEPTADGREVQSLQASLTVGDELDKLAWNVAVGRAFAGVQWRSDAEAGLRLGETVALALLRELAEFLPERTAAFEVRQFDGQIVSV